MSKLVRSQFTPPHRYYKITGLSWENSMFKSNCFQKLLGSLCCAVLTSIVTLPMVEASEPLQTLEYGEIKAGKTAYTFMPSTKLEQVATGAPTEEPTSLRPGTSVQVLEKSAKNATVNGFEDFFYKVKVAPQPGIAVPVTGIIWGGYLSKSAIPQGKAMLILAISGKGKDKVEKNAKALLIDNGNVLSETSFDPIELAESHSYSYSISASKFASDGFTGKPPITLFRFEYGACDYPYGDVLISTVGNKVRFLLKEVDSGNETGGTGHEFVLPNQKGGAKNKLIVVRTTENIEEKKKQTTRRVYQWNGAQFVAIR